MRSPHALLPLLLLATACAAPAAAPRIHAARLEGTGGEELVRLRAAFRRANPDHDLSWHPAALELGAASAPRVAFVQDGPAAARLERPGAAPLVAEPPLDTGDAVLLRPGESLHLETPAGLLVFDLPGELPPELPGLVRPDHDPLITDTPGGCAEEDDAYRRILLTWLDEVGPHVLHTLNAHRVRIHDSFTHYHPVEGGFDEFYLVQAAPAGARLLTSEATDRLCAPESVTLDEVHGLLESRVLRAGDLVYLPRGTVHRGLGGAVVQVITIPGFRPGGEVGIDHHIRAIDERLGLTGEAALPYRAASSGEAVVR
jgi:hypothetical protein